MKEVYEPEVATIDEDRLEEIDDEIEEELPLYELFR
jgi:hypothetical protein